MIHIQLCIIYFYMVKISIILVEENAILYILLYILVLFILLSLSKIKVTLILLRKYEDDHIEIRLALLFGLINLNFKIPYIDIILNKQKIPGIRVKKELNGKAKERNTISISEFKNMYEKAKSIMKIYKNVLYYLISKTSFDYIKWHTEVGIYDACYTALCSGMIYAVKGSIMSFINNRIYPENIDIMVKPNYEKGIFEVDLHCIIRVKIANIIIAGIKAGYIFAINSIFKKGGEFSERTSY